MSLQAWQGSRRIVGVGALALSWSLLACGGIAERGRDGTSGDGSPSTASGESATSDNGAAQPNFAGPAGYGTFHVNVPFIRGVPFAPISYAVQATRVDPLLPVLRGVIAASDATTDTEFSLSLPQGEGYSLMLSTKSAYVTDDINCDAKLSPFAIRAGSTNNVVVAMTCTDDSGSRPIITIDPKNECPSLVDTDAVAMPDQVHVGETIWVSARAPKLNGAPVSYLWSIEQPELGYFDDAGVAETTFHCTAYAPDLRLKLSLFAGACTISADAAVSCLGAIKP